MGPFWGRGGPGCSASSGMRRPLSSRMLAEGKRYADRMRGLRGETRVGREWSGGRRRNRAREMANGKATEAQTLIARATQLVQACIGGQPGHENVEPSMEERTTLIRAPVAGVLDGNVARSRLLVPGICENWPTIRACRARGCVYWTRTGSWCIGMRIGPAGWRRVVIGFGRIPWPNAVLLNRMPRQMDPRATRTLRRCRRTWVTLEEILLVTSAVISQAGDKVIGYRTCCGNMPNVASRPVPRSVGKVGPVGLLLAIPRSCFRMARRNLLRRRYEI